jgi:AGCS family alanine or glycine:cation symporter
MTVFYICCVAVIFVGALAEMDMAWAFADITMYCLALINIPCCIILSGIAVRALKDFESQKKRKLNPVFRARNIGLDETTLQHWKD